MKIMDFFLFLWVIFALLDPDPATQINANPDPESGSAIRKNAGSGSGYVTVGQRNVHLLSRLYNISGI
jgi:hypothetical protein